MVLGGGGPDLQRLWVPPMMVAMGLCCGGLWLGLWVMGFWWLFVVFEFWAWKLLVVWWLLAVG